ncbi:MAG: glycosyltransferase family 2 protein [Arenicellales bacterium]
MLSVVIPTYEPIAIDKVLEGLGRQTNDAFEVIVVENGPATEGLSDKLGRYRERLDLKHEHLPEPGLNRARNHGVGCARYPLVALLDDDCVPHEDWARCVLDSHQRYPRAGVIGGRVDLAFASDPPSWLQGEFRSSLAEVDWGDRSGPLGRWQHVVGTNLSFRKEVFQRIGGFQRRLGLTGREEVVRANDEAEFVLQATLRGDPGAVYAAGMRVDHLIPDNRVDFQYMLRRRFGQGVSDIEQDVMLLGWDAAEDRLATMLYPSTWHLEEHERWADMMDAPERLDFQMKYLMARIVYLVGARERFCHPAPMIGRMSLNRRVERRAIERGRKTGAGLDLGSPDGNVIRRLQALVYRDRPPADPHVAICFLAGIFQQVLPLHVEAVSATPEATI